MAAKAGSVYVEIYLDKSQFDQDFKAAQRQVTETQKKLQMDLERNKIKFSMEKLDKTDIGNAFPTSVFDRISAVKNETAFLNNQLEIQKNKVNVARSAWEATAASKGASNSATYKAEAALMREQKALIALRNELGAVDSASNVFVSSMKGMVGPIMAVGTAVAGAYLAMKHSAVSWGQAVNDIVDITGMADEEASKLLGVMNIVGLSSEEAAGAMAKLAKNVSTAAKEQESAGKTGKAASDVFSQYGIAIRNVDGSLRSHSEIIADIIDVHREMKDGTAKTAMEMEIFGKTGYKMNDLLNLSKGQLEEYTKRVEKMGLVLSDSQKYENYTRSVNELQAAFKGLAITVMQDAITSLSGFTDEIIRLRQYVDQIKKQSETDANKQASFTGTNYIFGQMDDAQKAANEAKKQDAEEIKRIQAKVDKYKEAARVEATVTKEQQLARDDLAQKILELQGKTTQAQLLAIEKERLAWKAKTNDEVAATKFAEESKRKLYQDTIDSRLSEEVRAAKEAIKNGEDVSAAIAKASESRKTDEKQTYDARKAVQDFYGIKLPGDKVNTVEIDKLNNTIRSVQSIVQDVVVPKDKYGRTVFDPYAPTPSGQVIPGQNLTISVTVNANGMDAQSANQMGEIAAQKIIPVVSAAIVNSKTKFGGK